MHSIQSFLLSVYIINIFIRNKRRDGGKHAVSERNKCGGVEYAVTACNYTGQQALQNYKINVQS